LPLNLVLSYGDLARATGYRTRVLGELNTLDRQNNLDPFLLVFDRNPPQFEKTFDSNIPHQALSRSAVLQFSNAVAGITREAPIRLIHAHNLYSAALALLKRRRYGYKVVLDYHGRIPEEYVFLGKGGQGSRKLLECLERWCVKRADHIVVVSHKLAEYLAGRYDIPQNRISVIPCCADESMFRWDPARRDTVRSALRVSQKFVCTHLGSFCEWYDPEMITALFHEIRRRVDAHLLVITGDSERARDYLAARLPADVFTVRQSGHSEVPGLLNASDLGLLLLRPSPNIKTSSPAKFAEYLNCGVPVLITPDVGDFSEMVVRKQVGAVVGSRSRDRDMLIVDRTAQNRAEIGDQCMAAGRQLTWQAFSSTWSGIVSSA
jgi:glycosyltransferase involved in cell wall biosynthesis